ncbi:PKD domain-containing protein [Halobaculum gomorrense]|uniref:PKD domain-containing protein n=1 Tax=Halobaculum gomorrense TaxID=43928 RepID=A0A1M5UJ37_9EURY|nr:PKD domain-containing protein [Halobaculum gomorrense]SHH63025.1 hypothetical protein SAMN05443636_3035 [Halobaculum gomorrense]
MRCVSLAVALLVVASAVPASVVANGASENEPPLADAGLDQRVDRGAVVWLDGGGSLDPDGELVAHRWSIRTPDGRQIEPKSPTAVSTTFDASAVGRYEVTLTVTDDRGTVRSDTLYVDVAASDPTDHSFDENGSESGPNRPPTGRISGPDTVTRGESATFAADVYDPDGRVASYAWSNGEAGRSSTRTVDAPVGETVAFSVRVTDDDGATAVFRKSVTVVAGADDGGATADVGNAGPSAWIDGPDRVAVGEEAVFVLRARDADGTIVSGTWSEPSSSSGMVFRHTFGGAGEHTVSGSVRDDDGATATASKTVVVYDEGPPVASISGPDIKERGTSGTYTLDAVDPDGGQLTVSWNPAQSQLERESTRFVNHVGIEGVLGETVSVSATVTDDEGNSVTVTKETDVAASTQVGSSFSIPTVSPIRYQYYTHRPYRTSDPDTVEFGTYDFSTAVSYGEGKLVRVTWEFNDSTTMTQTLGRFSGRKRSAVRHTFISRNGGMITRSVRVTAIDADGQSTSEKWVSRVHSVATDNHVVFRAFEPGSDVPTAQPTIEPGERIDFRIGSYHDYKIEFGDGSEVTGHGTPGGRFYELSHVYDDPGTYTTRLFSSQGKRGKAIRTVVVTVQPSSYWEYRFMIESGKIQRVVSDTRPGGTDWAKVSVHRSGRSFTGRTREIVTTGPRQSFSDDNWVLTETQTQTRTRDIYRTRRDDPDGAGTDWRLHESNVRSETRTTYRDEYRWLGSRYRSPGWRFTGETRTRRIVRGDGHDHDRTRHTRSVRGDCTNWDLEPSPWGGFSRSCSRWEYDTEVWYSGHDHDGSTRWDTDYEFHREVAETERVWYHEYVGTRTYTVTVKRFAETEEWVEWLWERRMTDPKRSHSLTRPDPSNYLSGTLERVEVRCESGDGHYDHVKC